MKTQLTNISIMECKDRRIKELEEQLDLQGHDLIQARDALRVIYDTVKDVSSYDYDVDNQLRASFDAILDIVENTSEPFATLTDSLSTPNLCQTNTQEK